VQVSVEVAVGDARFSRQGRRSSEPSSFLRSDE
jgi:hypothetical protein